MALGKIPKLFVCNNNNTPTPEGYDRAWSIHEALTKIDLIAYVDIKIDSQITETLFTLDSGVTLDSETVLLYATYKASIAENIYLF